MKTSHAEMPDLPQSVAMRDVRRMFGNAANATINGLIDDGLLPQPVRPRRNMVLFERFALLQAVERMRATS